MDKNASFSAAAEVAAMRETEVLTKLHDIWDQINDAAEATTVKSITDNIFARDFDESELILNELRTLHTNAGNAVLACSK